MPGAKVDDYWQFDSFQYILDINSTEIGRLRPLVDDRVVSKWHPDYQRSF